MLLVGGLRRELMELISSVTNDGGGISRSDIPSKYGMEDVMNVLTFKHCVVLGSFTGFPSESKKMHETAASCSPRVLSSSPRWMIRIFGDSRRSPRPTEA